ncbi:MAG TPA: hypothetical protein GX522_00925 [Firmicutes bacterium]|nr:hypothetical protein [Bacillota bacterium]
MKIINFQEWKRRKNRDKNNKGIPRQVLLQAGLTLLIGYFLSFLWLPSWASVLLALTIVAYYPYPYFRYGKRYR